METIETPEPKDVPRGSAVERLVESVQEMIAERGLAFGDPLPTERELGQLFGGSRNTVREALQYLRAYGIIDIRPKTGAVLANRQSHAVARLMTLHHKISPASFREVQGFRKIVESAAGEAIIMRANEGDLLRLEQTNRQLLECSDVEGSAHQDFAFHDLLVSLAGNSVLHASYLYQHNAILDIMTLGKENRPINEATFDAHQEIIDALRARDRIAFAYLLNRHLDFGMQFVEAENHSPGDIDGGV
ncbi:FadR family transcriptional regulator [Rhizobium sp. KVB221]|uniref:FadR family transcriptional regulator n=1 Tax=Rhizobium setariae TaxID=2801340 RepID=A0A936YRJ2_9HYPH|nr:FCD domain-containing protein [Rhizobium setariae]MBL0371461.1 FadR family transcriptional regulator [Rhizobium setariae]